MSKVIKAIGKVAGVVAIGALALTGVGAIGAFGLAGVALGAIGSAILPIAGAIAMGASLLAGRPKAPSVPADTTDRLQSTIDPRTNRKFIFGNTAMATDIRDYEYTDNQTYCHQFIVVAAHKVAGIDQIWFNDKLAWTASGGAQGDYAGYLTVTPILEGNAGNAINISPRMGSTRRYTGCAYVHVRYKLTGNSKKIDSPFAQAIPSKMVIRGRGAYVYDPRLDSTVPGGSGSQRANDQSTWAWDDDASRNPALQLLWYLLGWRINGKLSVGCGLGAKRIDLESFITAANLCDESVALAAGGTEPRYRGDGIGSTGVGPLQMIDNIKAAMNADLDDVDGKLRLTVFHNDLADPVADFGDDDMVDGFNWNQTPDLSDMFNVVRGTFVDSSDASLYQMIDYPEVSLPSRDEIERIDSFDLAFVQSPSQAQRLAKQRLQRQQYGGTFETTFNARGWLIEKNAVVRLSCSVLGWTNKLFRVAQMEHRVDGTCPVVLREENAAIYAWDASESPAVEPADPSEYDYTLNPFYQGIEDASTPAWSDIVDDGGKPADNADVTASSQIIIVQQDPSITIYRSYDGIVKDGQLPVEIRANVTRGGVTINDSPDVSYSVSGIGGLDGKVSVDNSPSSPDKGLITIDDTVTSAGEFYLQIMVGSSTYGPYTTKILTQNDAAPTSSMGSGGSDSTLASITTTSFTQMSGTHTGDPSLDVIISGPSDVLRLSAVFYYGVSGSPPNSGAMICIGQYSGDGGITWSDMGSEVEGSFASFSDQPPLGVIRIPGSMNHTWTVTGLTAATYQVRLMGKLAPSSDSLTPLSGSATSSRG